jgi:hypothetical protein
MYRALAHNLRFNVIEEKMTMKKANKTNKTTFFALLTGLIISSAQAGVTVDSLKRSFTFKQRLVAEEAGNNLMELNYGYETALNKQAQAARRQGDLERYQVYAREIGRFIKEGPANELSDVPNIAHMQQTYLDRYTSIKKTEARLYMEDFKQLDQTLASAESRLTQIGRTDDAKRLRAERQALRETDAYVSAADVLNSAKPLQVKTTSPMTTAAVDPIAVLAK